MIGLHVVPVRDRPRLMTSRGRDRGSVQNSGLPVVNIALPSSLVGGIVLEGQHQPGQSSGLQDK